MVRRRAQPKYRAGRYGTSMSKGAGETPRTWALQAGLLAGVALLVFAGFYALDQVVSPHGESGPAGIARFFAFDPQGLNNTISSLAGLNVAVFGIVITVVSIIVQLSADRFTGVARMFLHDRVNVVITAFYVITCVGSVWISAAVREDYMPNLTFLAILAMSTGGLVIMAPYFGYVFWFLDPQNIVVRLRQDAVALASSSALKHDADTAACFKAQADTVFALEELTDITNNSISGKDKIIASAAVDALKDLAIEYLKVKPRASATWFSIGPEIRRNPDFVAMDPESLTDIEARKTWVEWKVMRQYLSIYNEALGAMRDVNYLIAIDTRYIGEAAIKANDTELMELVFRFLNSFLRSTLNAKDIRTTYNVLNQYRKLIESMLALGKAQEAIDGARHMKYYGLVAFEMNLGFVTETVGFDLAALVQIAHEVSSPAEQTILNEFLQLDRAPFVRAQEKALIGVRKAQVKLAAYYLCNNNEMRARAIARDMRDEPADRLDTIRRQLEVVESKDFWEIIDRGRNMEYMPANQRACLAQFFSWFDTMTDVRKPGAEA